MTKRSETKLFKYQQEGIAWLSEKKVALLADEMGLGKSAQAIIAADKIKAHRVLVICPSIARLNWLREFEKFASYHRDYQILSTSKDSIREHSVICSYDLATEVDSGRFGQFDLIIIDECHYLKNTQAKRTKKILGKKGLIHGQRQAKIWALSGTPAPNHAGELWPLLYTFKATPLRLTDWVQRFCNVRPSIFGKGVQITGTKRARIPELRKILTGVMLRRTHEQVNTQLPKITFQDIVVEPGEVDLTSEFIFDSYGFDKEGIARLEADITRQTLDAKAVIQTGRIELLKGLAKSVTSLRRYIGCQKIDAIAKMVRDELHEKQYDKIVIFAIHRQVIEGLKTRLEGFGALTLYGGTKFTDAFKKIDRFQHNPKYKVLIGNITACGIAINLTAANNVLMAEQEWTPAANAQAVARCYRHGQTKPVFVRMIGLAGSLDEHVVRLLKKKTEELTMLLDPNISTDSIRPLSEEEKFKLLMR